MSEPTPHNPATQPLGLTVHSMPAPQAALPARRTAVGRLKMFLVLAACAAPVVASYLAYFVVRPDGRSNYAELILPTRTLPELGLTTLDGAPVPGASLRGQWLLVVVAGGQCDAACEPLLYMQRQLREMTGRERSRIDKVWLVTDDAPLRPEVARAVAAAPEVRVFRASADAVGRWLQPAPGQALGDHLYIVDPMGEWMMRAPPEPVPGKLKRDIDRLLRASAFWDREGR